eukprot:scaffold3988_cov243-Pinguiococcus_pyrenoidosus.AAC.5
MKPNLLRRKLATAARCTSKQHRSIAKSHTYSAMMAEDAFTEPMNTINEVMDSIVAVPMFRMRSMSACLAMLGPPSLARWGCCPASGGGPAQDGESALTSLPDAAAQNSRESALRGFLSSPSDAAAHVGALISRTVSVWWSARRSLRACLTRRALCDALATVLSSKKGRNPRKTSMRNGTTGFY